MSDLDFDLMSASWRHDARDELSFIVALAERLEKSLPGLTKIDREHKLFSKDRPIVAIEVTFGEQGFRLVKERGSFVARKAKIVRGIVLSTKDIALNTWLEELSQALSSYVNEHHEMRQTLEDFLL
nr:hypothetical protein [Bacilli bacterium]